MTTPARRPQPDPGGDPAAIRTQEAVAAIRRLAAPPPAPPAGQWRQAWPPPSAQHPPAAGVPDQASSTRPRQGRRLAPPDDAGWPAAAYPRQPGPPATAGPGDFRRPGPAPVAQAPAAAPQQQPARGPAPAPRPAAGRPAQLDPPQPGVQARPARLRGLLPHRAPVSEAPARFRPVRHDDPEPATFRLAAEALDGHLVIAPDRVTAWYRLPMQAWTFRGEGSRLATISAGAARIAQLSGRRCHLRVTSRPFEAPSWAKAFDHAIRGPAAPDGRRRRPAMAGPCPDHPDRSSSQCPTCVPGAAWMDWLLAQQRRLRGWQLGERDVYLGVEVTARNPFQRVLGQWSRVADAERASLIRQAEIVTAAVEGPGLRGRPAAPEELQWLLIRSCSIGLPAPLPFTQDPRPAPFALPPSAPPVTGPDGLAGYASDYEWAAEPFGGSVQVTRAADGLAAHVTVLSVADMTGPQDLAGDSPWLQRTDRLDFPCEWSVTFDVLDPRRTGKVMARQADKIRAQWAHIAVEHGQDPPRALERQLAAARRIEDDAASPESAANYVYAWPRVAVAGDTPEEARRRAAKVAELYAPSITVKQQPGQFRLLREFIPGEPLGTTAGRRFMHAELLAGSGANVSVRAGQRNGFPVGVTTATAARAVLWDPWYLMERANRSGLVTVTGSPGGGKSAFAGLMAYMWTRAGFPVTVLDPSGMMDQLCHIPALAGHATAINLLDAEPGTLCPYALIPSPRRGDYRHAPDGRALDQGDAERAWDQACRRAEAQRRALAEDILRMLLPARALERDGAEDAIAEAVRRAPAGADASPRDVIDQLRQLDSYGLENRGPLLAGRLETLAEHPLAALFFPRAGETPAAVGPGRRLLTVMTLRSLVIPSPDGRPEDYSIEERLSLPILHLAAQLLRRMNFDLPRYARKGVIIDEAHHLLRDATGVQQVNEQARDSRKNNTATLLISHNPSDLERAGVANLVGAGWAFRTEGTAELAATCGLLGLPAGRGYEERIAGLSAAAASGGHSGECLFRDGVGGLEQVQVDLGPDSALRAALSTTPTAWTAAPEEP
jgi:hypothetical protein